MGNYHQAMIEQAFAMSTRIGIQTGEAFFRTCAVSPRWRISSSPLLQRLVALCLDEILRGEKNLIRYNSAANLRPIIFCAGVSATPKSNGGFVNEIQSTVSRFCAFDVTAVTKKARRYSQNNKNGWLQACENPKHSCQLWLTKISPPSAWHSVSVNASFLFWFLSGFSTQDVYTFW